MEHLPAYVVDWGLDQGERAFETFTQFLATAGVKFEVTADHRKMLEAFRKAPSNPRLSPREMFEESLMRAGNKTLETAGDPRRLYREVGEVRRWRLLTPEEVNRAKESGMKLETAGASFRRGMWTFATVPVAIGTYVITSRVLRAQGVEENMAWVAAIAAWFIVRQVLDRTLLKPR